MEHRESQSYRWNGHLYIPFHSVPLAAGLFLAPTRDFVERHLKLPLETSRHLQDRCESGYRLDRPGLRAAKAHGDSMIDLGILHGDIVVFQQAATPSGMNGRVVVIEKSGDEEGYGAWALKRLVTKQPRLSTVNEFQDEIDFDSPILELRSHNFLVSAKAVDPSGTYRIHGVFLRAIRSGAADFVDSEWIRRTVFRENQDKERDGAS